MANNDSMITLCKSYFEDKMNAARMYPQGCHESKELFWLIFNSLISFSFMRDVKHQDTD